MSNKSITSKTSPGKKAPKPTMSCNADKEAIEVALEGKQPNQVQVISQWTSEDQVAHIELGDGMKFSWKVDGAKVVGLIDMVECIYARPKADSLLLSMTKLLSTFLRTLFLATTLIVSIRMIVLTGSLCLWLVFLWD